MNQTTNYNLPQWEATDRVTRNDVNGAMSSIDTALSGAAQIATGSYTGNGTSGTPTVVNIGFTPSCVLIVGSQTGSTISGGFFIYPARSGQCGGSSANVTWTDTGLSISSDIPAGQLNVSGKTYRYIAFR